jgi:hypothetical protein
MSRTAGERSSPKNYKLTFVAEKPPPSRVFTEVTLIAAEPGAEYF